MAGSISNFGMMREIEGNNRNILDYLRSGLKAENARQQAIANNMANMNTPGYRREAVKFEEFLQDAMKSGDRVREGELSPEFFIPKATKVKANGNDVSLDHEVGEMVKNSLRFRTYNLLIKNKYKQIDAAMNTQ